MIGLVSFGLRVLASVLLLLLGSPEGALFAQQHEAQQHEATGQHKHTNALAKESSPYLLLHAHNPVQWHPWNEQVLQKAKDEGKPIFLSVGYSSCHWCHVMERESFLDEEIANFLNENFICIKVDREERPDVDQIYMESLNVYNHLSRNGRGGGWPLSMFLTPTAKPFFGGTYFPARDGDRGVGAGFLTIVKKVSEGWNEDKERVERSADQLTKFTRLQLAGQPPIAATKIPGSWLGQAIEALQESYDPAHGGFGFSPNAPQRPKFPEPSNLLFLASWIRDHGSSDPERMASARKMLLSTCEKMSHGGIRDHLGGGFHRYSVDRFWAIPHFEKMLYDNGQLATVYSEAYLIEPDPEFKRTVDGILSFVQREMLAPGGGFYSALDAESEGEEGKFYRWTKKEVAEVLAEDERALFSATYRLNEPPNFEKEFYAPQLKQSPGSDLAAKLEPARQKLFAARSKRIRPLLDNKILTSWNGMMIRGFADAGRVFKNKQYIDVASNAADFAMQKLVDPNGRLKRTSTKGVVKLNAYLDDYACLIDGLLALHRATDDPRWIQSAELIQKRQDELFADPKNGGYFYTSADHETLLVRSKRTSDRAVPSGASVAAGNLLYLARVTGNKDYAEKAKKTVLSASGLIDVHPVIAPRMLVAVSAIKAAEKATPATDQK